MGKRFKSIPEWTWEERATAQGFHYICGCDEAGAGPLAGPLYAAAVILPPGVSLPGLKDSKQVTPKRREILFEQIKDAALDWKVASVPPEEIDKINILNARIKAMQEAIDLLYPAADYALVDGNRNHGSLYALTARHELVVRGDCSSMSIAAASIVAKVARDHYMIEMAEKYPQYHFEQHKGYGTKLHYAMLEEHGPSPIHRKSFLKKWEARRSE
ncbi:MAG: ribonuclease HII [Oscillospiraceae bacterium]|nr:ribonuclease HII [Oscillospiraceae bacterium]